MHIEWHIIGAKGLTDSRARLLHKTLQDFSRAGADLDDTGAWTLGLKPGERSSLHRTPHCVVFASNLTAPTKGQSALPTHSEVEIIFHEFGHVMHHCLSEVQFRTLSGTRVARDFVELPSQIMENWCCERDALDFEIPFSQREILMSRWNYL
jgi:Zn-dependent oligopeptidase